MRRCHDPANLDADRLPWWCGCQWDLSPCSVIVNPFQSSQPILYSSGWFFFFLSVGKRNSGGIPSAAWHRKRVVSMSCSSPLPRPSHTWYCTRHTFKDPSPCLPALYTSPATEGWALLRCVQQASKLNDLTKEKRRRKEKGQVQRWQRRFWWPRDRGGTSPEAYAEPVTDYVAEGLAEALQPYSENPPGDEPGVYAALNPQPWPSRRSPTSVLWEGLHCNQSCCSWASTPWFSILICAKYFLALALAMFHSSSDKRNLVQSDFWTRPTSRIRPWNLITQTRSAGQWGRWSLMTDLEALLLFPWGVFSRLMLHRAVPRHKAENMTGKNSCSKLKS